MLMLKGTYKSLVAAWPHCPELSIDDLAAASKSTGREVLSHLGRRSHRIYYAI